MHRHTGGCDTRRGPAVPLDPTPIHVPDKVLADLQQRLALTRWPDDALNEERYYGVNRAHRRSPTPSTSAPARSHPVERRPGLGSSAVVGPSLRPARRRPRERRAAWYDHVNLNAHDHGGHFIPWELPDQWVDDLRRTFRGRR